MSYLQGKHMYLNEIFYLNQLLGTLFISTNLWIDQIKETTLVEYKFDYFICTGSEDPFY